jgi:type VI secretion system protein ImpK
MSDKGRPFDPFGRGDRTIIRPNPGGRRTAAAAPAAPSQTPQQPTTEDWMAGTPRPTAPPPPSSAPVQTVSLRPGELEAPNENALMRAAGPLLLLLGRLRANLVRAHPAQLMEQVAQALQGFEDEVRSAGVPAEQLRMAKYALAATADDIVQNMPVEDRQIWTQYSMLSRFFGERVGGVRFFEELDRAKTDPVVNYPVLELMHACLALGFEGIHRTTAGGVAILQQIQRSLYDTLRRVKRRANEDISPRWQGQSIAARAARNRVPFWAVASIVAVLLFIFYLVLRTLLGNGVQTVEAALAGLNPEGGVTIERAAIVPPPPPPPPPPPNVITQLQRIRAALSAEISAGKLNADQTANEIVITVGNLSLFAAGKATVLESFQPIAAKIADTLEKEPGYIKVIGHTDNTPIKTVRFPSNYELSVERAQAVADILKPRLSRPERLRVEGKGADSPVVPNTTPEGKARNRRVEIMIPRAE